MPRFELQTWTEARDRLARGAIAILPVGSTEAHGPHLPLSTDVIISEEMSLRACEKLNSRGLECLVMPAVVYSVTDFSIDFPGTISIKKETASALIRDVCLSLYEQGAKLVVIANSHLEPEHIASITDAIAAVRSQTNREVVFPDKRRRRWAEKLGEEFLRGDCHAGSYETSLVMAARSELVRDDVRQSLERVPISIGEKIKGGAKTFNEAGGSNAYFGDPRAASSEEGEKLYETLSDMLVTAVMEALS